MASKKHRSFAALILDMVLMVPSLLGFVSNAASFIKMEAQLTVKNLIIIILLSVLSAILLAWTWLGLLAMLFIYLISVHVSAIFSLFFILIINFLLLLVVILTMTKIKNHLFCAEHREQFCSMCRKHK